ncbi:MAG TPA: GAF domain-containing SpoIIE family protein phosphatase [Bellilinea sp.]|nr:GAF domain-containing SpoIIE family protein phosphatase [Bellilinea sp.]
MVLRQGISRETERLSLLYRISQTINSSLDLDEVLKTVLDEVIAATRAERAFLVMTDGEVQTFRVARGQEQTPIDDPRSQVSRGVIDRVLREGRPLLTSNAQSEDWLSERKSVMMLGLRSVLCVPLRHKGSTSGIIYVDNRVQSGIFTSDDLDLLNSIASSAAVAIENARLYQLAIDKGRLERELQLAHEVQVNLLPVELPQFAGWEFAARWDPAYEVAGDFYDLQPTEKNRVCAVVADVSDKGMAAALYMAISRTIIRASVLHTSSLSEGIRQANQLICQDSHSGMFVTVFYGQLNPTTGTFTYVNAGHNPPLHYSAANHKLTRLTRTGMALGVDESAQFVQHSIKMAPDDFILLYTDGVTEAFNLTNQAFGEKRLEDILLEHRHPNAAELVDHIVDSVKQFSQRDHPSDDLTLVVLLRRDGKSAGTKE